MDRDEARLPLDDDVPEVRLVPAGAVESPSPPGLDLLGGRDLAAGARDLLHEVIDPEIGLDIVELGLLRSVEIEGGVARVEFTVTTPACPLSSYIENEIRSCLWQLPDLREVEVECVYQPAWTPEDMSEKAKTALGWG
ncbi:MAG: metal-sulfur cluster assembly factor [Solirubrobacterales bacterium]|nr:metal-sulfur cluster assembly factor [Solirubrobacterales bacterium]